jgi:hypothetical protein
MSNKPSPWKTLLIVVIVLALAMLCFACPWLLILWEYATHPNFGH